MAKTNINDFGKKIGGAKKDLYSVNKELRSDVFDQLNIKERAELIKKDKMWKKEDYQALLDDGLPVEVIYFRKLLRDVLPVRPASVADKYIKEYMEFVEDYRDSVKKVVTLEDISKFFHAFYFDKGYLIRGERGLTTAKGTYVIDNKMLKAAQKSMYSLQREIKSKKFLYSDNKKIFEQYYIVQFSKKNHQFEVDYNQRTIMKYCQPGYTHFFYLNENESESDFIEGKFYVYRNRLVKINIDSEEDAKKYILSVHNEPKKLSKERKKRFVPEQLLNIERDGIDYTYGCDMTGQDYLDVFNFKGGEFGNWMNEQDRQVSLNYGFNALKDLAIALKIKDEDIAIGNSLSIAFGARGVGNAAAHYEPLREVINLTKMNGAGSLAHEFGHALDFIIAEKQGNRYPISEYTSMQSMKNLMKVIRIQNGDNTNFYKDALYFDKHFSKESKGYWSSNVEMFARAFACYVKDQLNYRSDYLVGHADNGIIKDNNNNIHRTFPYGEERKIINQHMEILLDDIRNKGWLKKDTDTDDMAI